MQGVLSREERIGGERGERERGEKMKEGARTVRSQGGSIRGGRRSENSCSGKGKLERKAGRENE